MKVQVDFESLASNPANAMRRVTQMFMRAGVTIIKVESDGKAKRAAGIGYREVVMSFADSQHLTLRVKATGDVFQVLVNSRLTPIKEQDDPTKSVAELIGLLDAGRAKFQRRLAAIQMRPPEGAKTAAPKLREALQSQIAQVETEIEAATAELAELQAG